MTTYSTVGKPIVRAEGPEKVTGDARYPADIVLPGLLWGKCLRSPLPHARILSIDASKAKGLQGVDAVITAADIPDTLVGRRLRDMPVLAREKVRFIGEKVAAVAAESPDVAEEALELIDVEYEELPAVFDAVEATQPGAPILHEGVSSYEGLLEQLEGPTNRFVRTILGKGDVEKGFAETDLVFEHTFAVPWIHQAYLEPHACLVQIDDAGRAHIWANNKAPFGLREQLAAVALIEPERIVIHPSYIGGDFGGKGDFMDVPVCYFLAKAAGRPVKMVMTYVEEFMAGNPRHQAVMTIRTAVNRDGTLVARQGHVVFNSGAYGAFKPVVNIGGIALAGSYNTPHVNIVVDNVYTNNVPGGHMRAPGSPQTVFAEESHMDMIAQELGMGPLELRLKNIMQDGDTNPEGHSASPVRAEETLRKAAEAAGWSAPKPRPYVGRGMALYDRHTGRGQGNASLKAEADGTLVLRTPTWDQGVGTHTILRQIVAEELSLSPELIRVVATDTDAVPFDSGVGGSRATHTAGQATYRAAQQLRQQLVDLAAEHLSVSAESVRLKNGQFLADGDSTRATSLTELAARAAERGEPIAVQATYTPESRDHTTSFCAQVAEVEVDPETGQVTVLRFVSAHDVGTVLNPMTHQGQIDGGIVQGIGHALMEELRIDQGQVTTGHFGDYKIPTMRDIPELTTVILEGPAGPAPYQARGIGETPNCPPAAAIANAVADAVGVRITSLPITAEKAFFKPLHL